jgi:hypothetical protein
MKLKDQHIEALIQKFHPLRFLFGKKLTASEIENWCSRFMASQISETKEQECLPGYSCSSVWMDNPSPAPSHLASVLAEASLPLARTYSH